MLKAAMKHGRGEEGEAWQEEEGHIRESDHAELGLQLNLQVLDRAAQLRDLRPAALQGFGVGGHLAVQLLRLEGRMGPWGLRKLAEVRQRAGAIPEP